jgi:ribosome-associated protein
MKTEELLTLVETTLDDAKGEEIKVIDVRGRTTITDYMVIATGSSRRHVKALSSYVAEASKEKGLLPLGVEGDIDCDWVLVDLREVIVHLMTAQSREFYQLEKLWEAPAKSNSEELTSV